MKKKDLLGVAEKVVCATQKNLPAEIRIPAENVPVILQDKPDMDDEDDPEAALNLLGLFDGPDHTDAGEISGLSPRIFLYLFNIWEYVGQDLDEFREEVRITYLHELGHYLGWDEDEMVRHGLD